MDDREVERSCLCRERQGDQQSADAAFGPEEESYCQSEPRDSTQTNTGFDPGPTAGFDTGSSVI